MSTSIAESPIVDLDQYKYLPLCKICKRKNNEEVNNIWKNGKTGIFQFNIFVYFSGLRKKYFSLNEFKFGTVS